MEQADTFDLGSNREIYGGSNPFKPMSSNITTAEQLERHLLRNSPGVEFFVARERASSKLMVVVPERHAEATRQWVPYKYNGVEVSFLVIPHILDDTKDNRPGITA